MWTDIYVRGSTGKEAWIGNGRPFCSLVALALGIAVGAAMTGFLNAMQHLKVAELYKADLVTSEGKEASMFLAELAHQQRLLRCAGTVRECTPTGAKPS